MAKRVNKRKRKKAMKPRPIIRTGLYELEVFLLSGLVTEEFVEDNPVVSRTILIRGDQTLEKLHDAIFEAYERSDSHMYEFQIGSQEFMDPKARRYVLPFMREDASVDSGCAGLVTTAKIGGLDLKEEEAFMYWFDFGDDWWHQINVKSIREEIPPGEYPQVTERVGESPPQYPDMDDEEWDEDEDRDDDDET